MNSLEIIGVQKDYGDFSLNDVTFTIPSGTIMGFVGENGAGKTTTIKAILNLIHLDAGEIHVFGLDHLEKEKEIKSQIGVVFDECSFHENLMVRDIPKILRPVFANWDDDLFERYQNKFHLPSKKMVKELSKGMQMKLSIAAALSHQPKLLILDEATSGLDPIIREEILDIFLDFIQDEEHSILISSHIISDLDKIADYITFIHEGRIVFTKSRIELTEQMGILKCGAECFSKLPKEEILRYRKGTYGYEVLVPDKRRAGRLFPDVIVDSADTEDIMLFYIKGQK